MTQTRTNPTLQAPTPTPIPTVQLNLTGKLIYPAGPYGSNRPVRHRGDVILYEGVIISPHRKPQVNLPTLTGYTSEQVMMSWGDIVTLKRGRRVSRETFTDREGRFSFVTDPIEVYTPGLVLQINDYNPVSWGGEIPTCYYEARPDMNFTSPQGIATIRVPWQPPMLMTMLAKVGGERFLDHQKLARRLCSLVRSPSYPTTIVLSRESELDQKTSYTTSEDYTTAEEFIGEWVKPGLPPDLPGKLVDEVRKIPRFSNVRGSTPEAIASILERLITVNLDMLEHGTLVIGLYKAISDAFGGNLWIPREPDDPVEDMAAICAFLAIAGVMARSGSKLTVQFKNEMRVNDQKMLTVEVTITR